MSEGHTGKILSEEHKQKISESCKGKAGKHMLGRRDSEQTRKNKSEAAKRGWEKRRKS